MNSDSNVNIQYIHLALKYLITRELKSEWIAMCSLLLNPYSLDVIMFHNNSKGFIALYMYIILYVCMYILKHCHKFYMENMAPKKVGER